MIKNNQEIMEKGKVWREYLPFEYAALDSGAVFENAEAEKMAEIEERIFDYWYNHQDKPILNAIESIKIAPAQTADDYLNNLMCDVFLYAKRAAARKLAEGSEKLKAVYSSEERADFSIKDAEFQQKAVLFLLHCKDQKAIDEFWDYFVSNQESAGKSKKLAEESKKGLLALIKAIGKLSDDGLEVIFPAPKIDARDKIDLVAGDQNRVLFVQVKNAKKGEAPGFYNEEYFANLQPANSGEKDQLEKIKTFFKCSADYGQSLSQADAKVYLATAD